MGNTESAAASLTDSSHQTPVPEKAQIAKRQIEIYYRDFVQRFQARRRVNARIDYGAVTGRYDEQTRLRLRREQFVRELEYIRRRRQPLSMAHFHIIRKIGQGSYGGVFLVRAKATGELFAIKKLLKSDMVKRRQVSHVWLERFVLATVGEHPHVVKMFYSFQDTDYLYLVMEYLPGGDLLNMLIRHGHLPENWARFYIAELIVAIDALHRTGIIHRDIKPDNVLFSSTGHVVLSDFGLCKFVLGDLQSDSAGPANAPTFIADVRSGEFDLTLQERRAAWQAVARNRVFSAVGTPSYIAPEVLNESVYTEACDWWSVGAILYEMLIGVPPFLSDTPENTIAMIRNWRAYLEFPTSWPKSRLSDEALDLMGRLLCDASVRLGTHDGLEEFKRHPFFHGVDWSNLAQQKAPFVPELEEDDDTRYFDEEFPTPPLQTSNATDSNDEELANKSSDTGSVDTAVCTSIPSSRSAGNSSSSRRMSATRRRRSTRLRDLEFLGFTYMPIHADTHTSWHSSSTGPSSAPPRAFSAGAAFGSRPPPRVRSTTTLPGYTEERGFARRSKSAATALHRMNAAGGGGTSAGSSGVGSVGRRTTSAIRSAHPLPPHPRTSRDGGKPQVEDAITAEGSIHALGISPVSESRSEGGTTHESRTPHPSHIPPHIHPGVADAPPQRREQTSRHPDVPPETRTHIHTHRNTDTDDIVQGLGAVTVTERYPAEDVRRRGTALDRRRSVTNLAAGDEASKSAEIVPPPAAESDAALEPHTTHGRAHKLSLLPPEVTDGDADRWAVTPLDADALAQSAIEVPSTEDVVRFVEDAVEGLEAAAKDLDVTHSTRARAGSSGKDLQAVIAEAAQDLNGTALELHRHLSESSTR